MNSTNKSIIFVLFKLSNTTMKRRVMLTESEFDLIETVRNYKRCFPNGEPGLRWAIERMLAELLDERL